MAPLPHNNTAIYYVDYSVDGQEHTFEVRFNGAVSPSAFGSHINGFLGPLAALLDEVTINVVRFQAEGSDVSNPVVAGIEGNTYGTGTGGPDNVPRFLNFVGRSSGGRRVRLAVFGYKGANSVWRLTSTESTDISDAVDVLNGTSGTFIAIDGIDAIWYPYANIGYNAYWQRKERA